MSQPLLLRDLLEQLKRWRDSGQLKKNSAQSMKSASERVLSVLGSPDELDIRQVDLDEALQRFHNLNPDVSPRALRDYKSRIERAIREFTAFKEDPMNWKPQTKHTSSVHRADPSRAKKATAGRREQHAPASRDRSPQGAEYTSTQTLTIPFPLRRDLTVTIAGLPRDLKTAECERLSAFLHALAIDYPTDEPRNSAAS